MFYDRIPNLQNVGPGKTAILTLPLSATFDKIKLKLGGGLLPAKISRIEGKANGKTFFVDDGAKLVQRQAYKGIYTDSVDPAWCTIDFTEPNSRGGAVPQYLASIPANLLKSLTFEITLAADAAVGSTMEAHAEFRAPTQNPFIRKQLDFNVHLAGAGTHDLYLPSGISGGIIKRIWLHTTGHVTESELRINRQTAQWFDAASLDFMLRENGLTPQSNVWTLDFIADGNLAGALNTQGADGKALDVQLRLTTDAAETISGYLELIDPIGRL